MKVHDKSKVPQFLKMLEDLTKYHVEIGIFGDQGLGASSYLGSNGTTTELLVIAHVNEFGCNIEVTDKMRAYLHTIDIHLKASTKSINIPERSFMRAGYDDNKSKFIARGNKLLTKVIRLELPVHAFYEALGEYMVGRIQKYLTSLRTPPNHPTTIKDKGSSNPLIDTGRLRQSITYKVVKS